MVLSNLYVDICMNAIFVKFSIDFMLEIYLQHNYVLCVCVCVCVFSNIYIYIYIYMYCQLLHVHIAINPVRVYLCSK